jgi:geranylgeranyl diphosphate synthase type I
MPPAADNPLAAHQDAVNTAIAAVLERAGASGLPLYRMMAYALGLADREGAPERSAPPERVLGALALEAGGQGAIHAAVAMELLAASVLVHQQMQTGAQGTPERPAVWWVWGPAQAINVGDALHALARLALLRPDGGTAGAQATTMAATSALDAAALTHAEGQFLELTYQERVDVSVDQFTGMARKRRGGLLGGALAVGAAAGDAVAGRVDALRAFGEALGVAAQMADDLSALWGEPTEEGRGRALSKSKLYPVVEVLERADLATKRALGNVYFQRVLEPAHLDTLREVLERDGARERCTSAVVEAREAALTALSAAGEPPARWAEVAASLTPTPED